VLIALRNWDIRGVKLWASAAELVAVDYIPLPGDDWEVSTSEEEGLDPELVAELYAVN